MFHDQGTMSFNQGGVTFTVPLGQGDNNYPAKRAGFVNRVHERVALANAMQKAHDNSSASITLTNNSSMDVQVQQGLNKIVLAMNSSTVIDTKWELVVHIGQKHACLRNHHGIADLMNDSTGGMVKQTGNNCFEIVNSNTTTSIVPTPVPTPAPTPTMTTTMRLNPGQPIARVGATTTTTTTTTPPTTTITTAPAVAPTPSVAPASDGTRTIIVPPATTSTTAPVTPPTRVVPLGGIPQTRMVPPRRNPPSGGIPQTRMVPPRPNPPTDSTMAGSLMNATTRQAAQGQPQAQPPQPATTSVNAGVAMNMANHPGNDPNIVATRLMPGGAWAILSNVGNGMAYGQINTDSGEFRRWIRPSPPSPPSS